MTELGIFLAFGVFNAFILHISYKILYSQNEVNPNNDKAAYHIFRFLFLTSNFIVNVVYATIICLDPPREFFLCDRIKRYLENGGWRAGLALPVAELVLDIDPEHLD